MKAFLKNCERPYNRCQFHQHYAYKFFVWTSFFQLRFGFVEKFVQKTRAYNATLMKLTTEEETRGRTWRSSRCQRRTLPRIPTSDRRRVEMGIRKIGTCFQDQEFAGNVNSTNILQPAFFLRKSFVKFVCVVSSCLQFSDKRKLTHRPVVKLIKDVNFTNNLWAVYFSTKVFCAAFLSLQLRGHLCVIHFSKIILLT